MDYPHVPAGLDIRPTVGVLLKTYGGEAESIARQRAEGFIKRGDLEARDGVVADLSPGGPLKP